MKRLIVGVVWVSVSVAALAAQDPAARSPEHARLEFFVGRWSVDGLAEGGFKYEATETCEWFAGSFHVICRGEGVAGAAGMKRQTIIGYDRREKTYTYYTINNSWAEFYLRGGETSDVWSLGVETNAGGVSARIRAMLTRLSPTSYSARLEGSRDGGDWTAFDQAILTKLR